MNYYSKYACALILAGGLAAPAYAAAAGTSTTNSNGDASSSATNMNAGANDQSGNSQNAMHIGQKLRADLGKAGYTDISVIPSSFVVHAKDSQGNPVMMVISPDSVTSITEQNPPSSASNANHASSANGGATSTAPATPGNTAAPAKP